MRVVGFQGIPLVIYNKYWTWCLGEVHTVLGEAHATTWQSILFAFGQMWSLKMNIVLITLELASP